MSQEVSYISTVEGYCIPFIIRGSNRVDVLVSSMNKLLDSISMVVDDKDNGTESMPDHRTNFLTRQIR